MSAAATGGGGGGGASRRDEASIRDAAHAQSLLPQEARADQGAPVISAYHDRHSLPGLHDRVEAYTGENEELAMFHALLSPQDQQPSELELVLGDADGSKAAAAGPVGTEALGPEDLLGCLRLREWDRALEILTSMVHNGEALNAAVAIDGVDGRDITRAHPELVIVLRGHSYFRMRSQGDAGRAQAYYRNHIIGVYPDGGCSTGNCFANTLLAQLKAAAQSQAKPRADHPFGSRTRPDKWVTDYLKVYFPKFCHETEEGSSRVVLFGERVNKGKRPVRCLACHKVFKGYNEAKLRYHLLKDPKGKQAPCKASTEYIREAIRKHENQDGNTEALPTPLPDVQAAPSPAPPDHQDDQDPEAPLPSTNNGDGDDHVAAP